MFGTPSTNNEDIVHSYFRMKRPPTGSTSHIPFSFIGPLNQEALRNVRTTQALQEEVSTDCANWYSMTFLALCIERSSIALIITSFIRVIYSKAAAAFPTMIIGLSNVSMHRSLRDIDDLPLEVFASPKRHDRLLPITILSLHPHPTVHLLHNNLWRSRTCRDLIKVASKITGEIR
jgi:hypothetical protein